MNLEEMGMKSPEDELWAMPDEDQLRVLQQIFSEEELRSYEFSQVQETAAPEHYEEATRQAGKNLTISRNAIEYIKRYNLLKDHQEKLSRIVG